MTKNCFKIDWLTCSVKPGSSTDSREAALEKILCALNLDKLWKDFVLMCSNFRYEAIYKYQNISIKIPTEAMFSHNGICVEMTGSGIDYYENYLALHKNTTLWKSFNRLRLLYLEGYKIGCSRIDVAIDDKCFGYKNLPLLDLDQIESALASLSFITKFRKGIPPRISGELTPIFKLPAPDTYDDKVPFNIINSTKLSTGRVGKTIYLGVLHKSPSSIRIYDKFAEQQVKGEKLPPDLNHWVRLELEFHEKNSMAVFSKFLDCKDVRDFSKYISRCIYDLIRFVDYDHTRTYNCTVCDWWMKFLVNVDGSGMYINKLSTNKFLRSKNHLYRCFAAILAAQDDCDPNFVPSLLEFGRSHPTKSSEAIKIDFKAYQGLSPGDKKAALEEAFRTLSGEDYWRMFADQTEGSFDERMRNIFEEVAQSSPR